MLFCRSCFFGHGFIQIRSGLLNCSCFCFMSNKCCQNLWMQINLRCQKTSFSVSSIFYWWEHTQWHLDAKAKVFHESNSCFMKCPRNCISWNALREIFHSVSSLPLVFHEILWKKNFTVYSSLFKQLFWKLPGEIFSQNPWKISLKKFVFSKVAQFRSRKFLPLKETGDKYSFHKFLN